MSEQDLEDIIDSCTLFSDPESEWTSSYKVEEPEDEQYTNYTRDDHRPEAERGREWSNNFKVPGFTYEEIDP